MSAAKPLQLFSTPRDGRASPLTRSIDDISSQLDRLSRTFHGVPMASGGPGGAGLSAAPSVPPTLAATVPAAPASVAVVAPAAAATLTGPAGADVTATEAAAPHPAVPPNDSTEVLLASSALRAAGGALFPFAPSPTHEE